MSTQIVQKTMPLYVLRESHSALCEAWSLVQEMCCRNPPGCKMCRLRCAKDENGEPIESERITDKDDPNYWHGCQYSEIPIALAAFTEHMED